MTNILKTNKTILTPIKKSILLAILGLILGSFATHEVDVYINTHDFLYQSPVVITEKIVSPIVIIKTVEATQAAKPVAKK